MNAGNMSNDEVNVIGNFIEQLNKLKMTPKQKAGELVALYEIIAHPKIDVDKQMAKLCAYKTVDALLVETVLNYDALKQVKSLIGDDTWYSERALFWNEVKSEIEKL
jgi:hypothetical protein